jgi:hypothetical protein
MVRSLVERRLSHIGTRLKTLREELAVLDEQRIQLLLEADDARLQALVSETPMSEKVHRSASRHVDVIERRRKELMATIVELETSQDELLDRLVESRT